jgi:hypothetical protein
VARCGVPRIDDLVSGAAGARPLLPGDSDAAAVGIAQELLRAHGFARLPDVRGPSFGNFGTLTRQSIESYRAANALPPSPAIDSELLQHMIRKAAPEGTASRGYLTLVLDFEFDEVLSVAALVSLFESGGRFGCLNLNTDRAGLSFGIIQWAQKPGRLHELLERFHAREPEELERIAGGPASVSGLLAHAAKPGGGVDATGKTTNRKFDLVAEPWRSRFVLMGRSIPLQKVQVAAAVDAFRTSMGRLRAQASSVVSPRALAFMLDLANQHGDSGALQIYRAASAEGRTETELLEAMERESVRRLAMQFGKASNEARSTENRRSFFRTTGLLSDSGGIPV